MLDVLICSHREWAIDISNNIIKTFSKKINIQNIKTPEEFHEKFLNDKKFDAILFIGWNEIIPKEITDNFLCVCLHPSLLPKYRGGSPIQHQMINCEEMSGVTIFKMDEGIDTGPIYFQKEFTLQGKNLYEVFKEIINIGTEGFNNLLDELLNGKLLNFKQQDETKSTYFKRRKPSESEIFYDDFENFTAEEIANKINSLLDPYPNAFIKCKDGSILYFTSAKFL